MTESASHHPDPRATRECPLAVRTMREVNHVTDILEGLLAEEEKIAQFVPIV